MPVGVMQVDGRAVDVFPEGIGLVRRGAARIRPDRFFAAGASDFAAPPIGSTAGEVKVTVEGAGAFVAGDQAAFNQKRSAVAVRRGLKVWEVDAGEADARGRASVGI